MKILLLPNAFKGSLSATQVIAAFTRAIPQTHTVRAFPISDGGDGFLDFFRTLDPNARLIFTTAKNAFLKSKRTSFLLLSDGKTAIIETARICGLGSAKPNELDPLHASSYGVGQVILKAIEKGAKKIYVGLGGVACNDGGAGMAVACGARLLDAKNTPLALGAQALLQLKQLDLSSLPKKVKGVQIFGVTDVTNPLLGPKSSAKVFGPQKGATAAQVKILDKAMAAWAHAIRRATGKTISRVPGTAAAGAIGAGLYGCFKAPLLLGADFLLQKGSLERHARWADLLITSEGKLDNQTFYGKAPLAVLKLAKKYQKPTLFICGQYALPSRAFIPYMPCVVLSLTDIASNVQDAKKHAARYIEHACKTLFN